MSTIFDIAREAGVSITTVSRALNGYSEVSEKTRQRVMEIAALFDYYPSAAARSLQSRRTDTVAFAPLLRDHVESEQFFKEFLGLLTVSAFRHNLSLLATVADDPGHTNRIYKELAGSGRVDGMIAADIKPIDDRIDLMLSLNLPFVAFGRTADYEKLNYALVDVDSAAGIRSVIDYLAGRGHTQIAYLSAPLNTSYGLYRYSGFKEGLDQHGLYFDENMVVANIQEHSDTVAALNRLMSIFSWETFPTAIVTANDHLALQVIQELQNRGLTVGADRDRGNVAVTGFDDLPFASYIQPGLTTVRQPIATISDILLDLLVDMIKREADSKRKGVAESGHTQDEAAQKKAVEARKKTKADPHIRWIGPMQALVEPELIVRASA